MKKLLLVFVAIATLSCSKDDKPIELQKGCLEQHINLSTGGVSREIRYAEGRCGCKQRNYTFKGHQYKVFCSNN